jgi:hypothetical protein
MVVPLSFDLVVLIQDSFQLLLTLINTVSTLVAAFPGSLDINHISAVLVEIIVFRLEWIVSKSILSLLFSCSPCQVCFIKVARLFRCCLKRRLLLDLRLGRGPLVLSLSVIIQLVAGFVPSRVA